MGYIKAGHFNGMLGRFFSHRKPEGLLLKDKKVFLSRTEGLFIGEQKIF